MNSTQKTFIVSSFIVAAIFIGIMIFSETIKADNIVGDNYRNVTVRTSVNITNSKPVVLAVVVYQESNMSRKNITLSGGLTRVVSCNATLRDWNGYSDITSVTNGVNATLYDSTNSNHGAADNNNTHYTNSSCTDTGNGANYTVNYLCSFNVYYYANNGTWQCNVTVRDTYNKTGSLYNNTIFYPLYALNVTDGINYGNVPVESDSLTQQANITNFGNRAINVSVAGYGATRGDNLAMICSISGNISIEYERFSITDTGNWVDKIPLNSSSQLIPNLTMPKQTVPGTLITNTTYWQLQIPPNPAGNCSGFILFQAEVP